LVFCATREAVNRLAARLHNRGFRAVALSGELTQAERTKALQALRDGRASVCVATDVAARGIDLPGLDLVVHAEPPTNAESLLHRSGRTGRAGAKGRERSAHRAVPQGPGDRPVACGEDRRRVD
jgi:ATP-dependent RNA helicase DeaD